MFYLSFIRVQLFIEGKYMLESKKKKKKVPPKFIEVEFYDAKKERVVGGIGEDYYEVEEIVKEEKKEEEKND